jgi:hypothetical protein
VSSNLTASAIREFGQRKQQTATTIGRRLPASVSQG